MENINDYPVITQQTVAWGDMDAFGHLNGTVYFRYFETGRIDYFDQLNYPQFMQRQDIGPILHSIQCRFTFPVTYPDTLQIGTKITDLKNDRFTTLHLIYSNTHQRVVAKGSGIIVTYDYRNNCKASIPDVLCARILALEAGADCS